MTALAAALALLVVLAPTALAIHRHTVHPHARHRLHRPAPYTDRIRPLITTRRLR